MLGSQLVPVILSVSGPLDDYRTVGYWIMGDPSTDQLQAAKRIVQGALFAADRVSLAKELTRIACVTISTKKGADLEGWMEALIDVLQEFPADVALESLRKWPRREKFLPTEAEIVAECAWRGDRRLALRKLKVRPLPGSQDVVGDSDRVMQLYKGETA